MLAGYDLDLLLVENDAINQGISRLECPVWLPVLYQEAIKKPSLLVARLGTRQDFDRSKHDYAGVHKGGVACIGHAAMQVADLRHLAGRVRGLLPEEMKHARLV